MGSDGLETVSEPSATDHIAHIVEHVARPVAGMHRVIADRVFRYTGPPGRLVQRLHDATAGAAYESLPHGVRAIGAIARFVGPRRNDEEQTGRSPAPTDLQSVVNALWGDRAELHDAELATPTTFRRAGAPIDPAKVVDELDQEPRHFVVLLHGLGQTESTWALWDGLATDATGPNRLCPLPVRYNTGRPVAETGAEVALLLEALWAAGPPSGSVVSLVGFSLGGLVAHAAHAALTDRSTSPEIRHIVTIASPHAGSPAAFGVAAAAGALRVARTTRPLAKFLDTRSITIRRLASRRPTSQRSGAAVQAHFVAGTVADDPHHRAARLFGDLVVTPRSAAAAAVGGDDVAVFGGRHHLQLVMDPEVHAQIVTWLLEPVTRH